MLATTLVGCGEKETYKDEEKIEFDDYSKGLDNAGFYAGWEDALDMPNFVDFNKVVVTYDDVINRKVDAQNELEKTSLTVDEWLYDYANEFLHALELTDKEDVAEKDIVVATTNFFIDGEPLDGYSVQQEYTVSELDESPITASMVGKELNEEYEIDYTMTVDDGEHVGKEAVVKIKIDSIRMGDPIAEGVVEDNLELLNQKIPNVETAEDLIKGLKPVAANTFLSEYMEYYIRDILELDVPDEYTEYELYRLKHRLNQMGMSYKKYLEEAHTTDELTRKYCHDIAKENLVAMKVFDDLEVETKDTDLAEYYGDVYEDVLETQGVGYATLKIIREVALLNITSMVQLVENVEEAVVVDAVFDPATDTGSLAEDTDESDLNENTGSVEAVLELEKNAELTESETTVAEEVQEMLEDDVENNKTEE